MHRSPNAFPIRRCAAVRCLLAGLTALLGVLAAGCGKQHSAVVATQAAPAPVETVAASVGTAVRWTPVTGSLVSLQDVSLGCRIAGRVAEVYVRQGDTVVAGQVVARIDTTDLESQRRSAEGAVLAARARVGEAEAAYRQQVTSSYSAVDSAEAALNQQIVNTKTGIQSAEAGLEGARAQLSQVREGSRTQEVRRGQTQVVIAQANRDKAASDLRRYRQLAKDGAVSQSTLEEYETAYRVAAENLKGAQETLSLLKEGSRTQEVTAAEQSVRQAEERLRQAHASEALDRVRHADLVTARAALAQNDVRKAEVVAAGAALQQAEDSLAVANKALADASVRSPIGGMVAARTAEPGQVVAAGAPILRVVGLDSVYFEPTVPDRDVAYLHVGQEVEVSVNAFPGRIFSGSVTRIYPAASAKSRAFPVRVTVANPDRLLRPAMYAEGRILTQKHAGAVEVPNSAILRDTDADSSDKKGRVFTVSDGIAHEHDITVGLTSADGAQAEVIGLRAPADVVVSGQHALSDGDRVTAKAAPAAQTAAAMK